MGWTTEKEGKLKELWKKGLTASQIASTLGDTTRNAVIGKAHRLNLEARTISKRSTQKIDAENNNTTEVKTQNIQTARQNYIEIVLRIINEEISIIIMLMGGSLMNLSTRKKTAQVQ